jgi:hypothetical protein
MRPLDLFSPQNVMQGSSVRPVAGIATAAAKKWSSDEVFEAK